MAYNMIRYDYIIINYYLFTYHIIIMLYYTVCYAAPGMATGMAAGMAPGTAPGAVPGLFHFLPPARPLVITLCRTGSSGS